MKFNIKQLLAYIGINILISAATMLLVLYLWQRAEPDNLPCTTVENPSSLSQSTPIVAAIPPLETEVIQIEVIYGVTYTEDEQVVLRRVGEGDLNMSGWWLEDENGSRYDFPASLTLNPGAELLLNTRHGSNTPLELFWGQNSAVWQNGETARLFDPLGNLRASFEIPE